MNPGIRNRDHARARNPVLASIRATLLRAQKAIARRGTPRDAELTVAQLLDLIEAHEAKRAAAGTGHLVPPLWIKEMRNITASKPAGDTW